MDSSYVLIAGADASHAALYRRLLEEEGFESVTVREGDRALAVLGERGTPALLVAELSLARADSFTLLRGLRSLASAEKSAVIVTSPFREIRATAWSLREELGI